MHNIKNISIISERIRLILACEFDTRQELRETRDEARRIKALHAKHSARQAAPKFQRADIFTSQSFDHGRQARKEQAR